MKLQRVKVPGLDRIDTVVTSLSYVVGCTGQRAIVMDRRFNLLRIITGLWYVYAAEVSPDETQLLLISNDNCFYVVDLTTWELRKNTIRAPYHHALEGRGCWSFDGKAIYVPVMRQSNLTCTLRCYRANDFRVYEDFLPDEYVIQCIRRIDTEQRYLMVAYDRNEEGIGDRAYMIWFDGSTFERHLMDGPCNPLRRDLYIHPDTGMVAVYLVFASPGQAYVEWFTPDGKRAALPPACEGRQILGVQGNARRYVPKGERAYRLIHTASGTYWIADAETGQVVGALPKMLGEHRCFQMSSDVIVSAAEPHHLLYQIVED